MGKCDEIGEETVAVTMDELAREVLLFGTINSEVASQVILSIRQLDRAEKKNIHLIISSGGGEEAAGWAIYDALCLTRCKVIGQCFGECMSIAALVLQGCDSRLLSPNCRTMVHNGTVAYNGPLDKVRVALKEENFLTQMYYEKLAEKSNLSIDKIKKLCDDETYFSAEEAIAYGLADGILGQMKKAKRKVRK